MFSSLRAELAQSADAWLPDLLQQTIRVSNSCREIHSTAFMQHTLKHIEIFDQNCTFLWNCHDLFCFTDI